MRKDYKKIVKRIVNKAETTDPFAICRYLDIPVRYTELGSLKGFTTTNYRVKTIFINEKLSKIEAKYSCAHELGHILMGHDYNKLWLASKTFFNLNRYENEANRFAVHLLLAPWQEEIEYMEYPSNDNISSLTGIPIEYLNLI